MLTHWVNGQREYFIKMVHRDDAKLTRSERFVRIFLLLGIAIAIASIFVLHHLNEWGEGLLLVAAGLAPVTAALDPQLCREAGPVRAYQAIRTDEHTLRQRRKADRRVHPGR